MAAMAVAARVSFIGGGKRAVEGAIIRGENEQGDGDRKTDGPRTCGESQEK